MARNRSTLKENIEKMETSVFRKVCKKWCFPWLSCNNLKQLWLTSSVQFSSVTQSCLILCDCMDCSMPGFPVHHQLLELAQTHVHQFGLSWVNQLILCRPPLLLPSIFPSIRVFPNESVLHIRWPKYWSFSFSTSPSNEYSGLISFRIDWFDFLPVQGTLKSPLKSINSSVLSFLYSPALTSTQDYWKTIALTIWTFVGKVLSLLFNILSRLVITFFQRSTVF